MKTLRRYGCVRQLCICTALLLLYLSSANAQVAYTTSWLGNTFPGGKDGTSGGVWVQNFIENIVVLPDGRVITNSAWDEAGEDAKVYQSGQVVNGFAHFHCCGGQAVAANSTAVFLSYSGGSDSTTHGVKRYSFAGDFLASAVINTSKFIKGLAASDTEVFVSDPASNSIVVLNAASLAVSRSFPFSNPGRIALDKAGTLWIVDLGRNKIRHFNTNGGFLGQEITDAGLPTALAIDTQGRLMVSDSGTRQQVLFYNISSTPALVSTFGTPGGIYSGASGQVGDLKLISPTGVGMDSSGNIYVSSSIAGADLRAFTGAGQKLWQLLGLEFVNVAVGDPASDGADVYTKHEHFKMDYSKGPGQEATWAGMTIDSLHYPTDPRIAFSSSAASMSVLAVRNVQGRKYLYITDQYAGFVGIYRFNGEIAVPSGFIMAKGAYQNWLGGIIPNGNAWTWRDLNGNGNIDAAEIANVQTPDMGVWGWEVDSQGNVYAASEDAGVVKYPVQGYDSFGNPIFGSTVNTPAPAPFMKIERLHYEDATDTMYLAGFTTDHPYQNGVNQDFGLAGSEIMRFDNWSQGNRTPRYRIQIPYDPANSRYVKGIAVAGARVFAGMLRSSSSENVYAFDGNTGAPLGQILPGAEINYNIGWIDGAENLKAFQRSTGEYLLFEEEVVWAKVMMFRMAGTKAPSSDTTPPTVAMASPAGGSVSGGVVVSATASDNIGVAGVQFICDGSNMGSEVTAAPYTINWDSTSVANGAHILSAIARDAAGNRTTAAAISVMVGNTITTSASTAWLPIRVNAGGGAFTDATGTNWAVDSGFANGSTYANGNAISGTTNPTLYQSERWAAGTLRYDFPVPNGAYNVNLKFAEIYYTQPGQRVFNIALNGQPVLASFDIVASAGPNTAVNRQFNISTTTGVITVELQSVVSTAKISGIEILQRPTVTVAVNPPAVQLIAGATQQFTAAVSGAGNTGVTWSVSGPGSISSTGVYTAPGTVSTPQSAVVKAVSVADSTISASATITVNPPAVFQPIRVNSGGGAYTDPAGVLWSADTGFTNGSTYQSATAISATNSPGVYQSERWASNSLQYQFTVPNGSYNVNLKFAEIYNTQAGQRVFNATINGQTVLTNFDIFAQAGGANKALDKQFPVSVSGGVITIQLLAVVSNPKISGIEIVLQPKISVAVNPPSAQVAPGATQQFTASVTGSSNTAVTWTVSGAGTITSSGLYTAPGTVSAAQSLVVKAVSAADGTVSGSATLTLSAGTAFKAIRVNAGGGAYTDGAGLVWSADTGFNGGSTYQTAAAISGTTAPLLYQSERWSQNTLEYVFTAPNSARAVTLKFAEIYCTAVGQRVFNVNINGQRVLTNFDIFAAAGGANKAIDKQFPVNVTTGSVVIDLIPVVSNVKISGLSLQ